MMRQKTTIVILHKSLVGILLCTYQKHEQRLFWIQRTLLTNTFVILLTVSGVTRWSSLIWSFWHFWQYNWLLLQVEWDYVLAATHNVVLMAKTLVGHFALPVPESVNFCETWTCLPWWVWAWVLQQSSGSSTQIPTRLEQPGQFLFRPNPYRQILMTLETIKLKCDTTSNLFWINYLFDSISFYWTLL